jgi:hypothetical protein
MSALLKCRRAASGNVITAEGRMAYVSLFKPTLPKGETDKSKERYQTSLVFPKAADLALLNEAVEACAVEKWGPDYKKKFKVKKPFLKTEDHPKIGLDPAEFPVFIRTNSPSRPQIVTATMKVVNDDQAEQVYSGRWASISVRPYTYDHPTGGKGVSLGLQNVQLLRDDEPLAATRVAAEAEFEPVEGAGGEGGSGTDGLFE